MTTSPCALALSTGPRGIDASQYGSGIAHVLHHRSGGGGVGGLLIDSLRLGVGEALTSVAIALLAVEVKEVVGAEMVVVKS